MTLLDFTKRSQSYVVDSVFNDTGIVRGSQQSYVANTSSTFTNDDCDHVRKVETDVSVAVTPVDVVDKPAPIIKEEKAPTVSVPVDLIPRYQSEIKKSRKALSRLCLQKDLQLDSIQMQLSFLESRLRKEQSEILLKLEQRDSTIAKQQQEITKLRRENRKLHTRLKRACETGDSSQSSYNSITSSSSDFSDNSLYGSLRNNRKNEVPDSIINPKILHMEDTSVNDIQPNAINSNVSDVRAVSSKPPVAEKPKQSMKVATDVFPINSSPSNKSSQSLSASGKSRQCSIVSTISRLLDEEADVNTSGSNDPSSPHTFKPVTPRVIKLVRKYEGEVDKNKKVNSKYNIDSATSNEKVIKNLLEEHEVTSGYNSDAVSEHEYENVAMNTSHHSGVVEEEDDNYVVLETYTKDATVLEVAESDDHLYSNIDFIGAKINQRVKMPIPVEATWVNKAKSLDDLLETNLDSPSLTKYSDSAPTSPEKGTLRLSSRASVGKCRLNINSLLQKSCDQLTDNFEEFTLDSLELGDDHSVPATDVTQFISSDSGLYRKCGDGAEMKAEAVATGTSQTADTKNTRPHTYEKFLEATGLSQKSILTPSRTFSNHRSMLKPRDVKHRDKLRVTFTTLSTLDETSYSDPYV